MEENLARASQKNIDVWAGNEVDYRHRLEDLQREVKTVQVGLTCLLTLRISNLIHSDSSGCSLFTYCSLVSDIMDS